MGNPIVFSALEAQFDANAKPFLRESKKVEKASISLGKSAKKLAATLAGVFAVYKTQRFITGTIRAFGEQEKAEKALAQALRVRGELTDDLLEKLKEQAAALQRVTTHGDEETLQLMTTARALGVQTDQLARAVEVAYDFAAATGIDARSALTALAKAASGNLQTLQRYGVIVKKNADGTVDFANVLDAVAAKMGGQARAEAQTFSGQLQQLANVWSDIKEQIGANVAKILTGPLASLTKWMREGMQLGPVVDYVKSLMETLRVSVTDAWSRIKTVASDAMEHILGRERWRGLLAAWDEFADRAVEQFGRIKAYWVGFYKDTIAPQLKLIGRFWREAWEAPGGLLGAFIDAVKELIRLIKKFLGLDAAEAQAKLMEQGTVIERPGPGAWGRAWQQAQNLNMPGWAAVLASPLMAWQQWLTGPPKEFVPEGGMPLSEMRRLERQVTTININAERPPDENLIQAIIETLGRMGYDVNVLRRQHAEALAEAGFAR